MIVPPTLTREDWDKLAGEALRVFSLNEVDQGEVYYHMPSHNHYPSLFGWDSGFHAAAMTGRSFADIMPSCLL